ncbi:DUF6992 family protein [Litorihabitans aurantiacus]|uniref:Uncharacterized protein n=1 Tax=Litorihabitans aurantiacus TaxID=1930061 RepID=A0AA38CS24_9MICO|nr:hypothetical protein [Litorihabitans aurantiacus]GMA33293.1 hypothetical protein GCM10025875_32850 [Litorihabitans aurantiacus]
MTLADRVADQELRLLRGLTSGAIASGVVGAAALAVGLVPGRRAAFAFGRQTLAWAAVDGVIAALGRRGSSRPENDGDARDRARRMRTITAVNAVADVGYVAGGLALARWKPSLRADGVAVVIQGAFLLVLDTWHARAFGQLARDAGAAVAEDAPDTATTAG